MDTETYVAWKQFCSVRYKSKGYGHIRKPDGKRTKTVDGADNAKQTGTGKDSSHICEGRNLRIGCFLPLKTVSAPSKKHTPGLNSQGYHV